MNAKILFIKSIFRNLFFVINYLCVILKSNKNVSVCNLIIGTFNQNVLVGTFCTLNNS